MCSKELKIKGNKIQRIQSFREWLEIKEFYEVELANIEEKIRLKDSRDDFNLNVNGIIQLKEAIIEPQKIKIRTKDVSELNKLFKADRIEFEISKGELRVYYNKQDDVLKIFFDSNFSFQEIEAMIAHELIHKEQHKRVVNNYFEQSKKFVEKINKLASEINDIDMTKPDSSKMLQDKLKKWENLLREFLYLSPYEAMAYACQFVKEYKNLSPSKIIKELELLNIPVNNYTKKYIGMYWLIRDKI